MFQTKRAKIAAYLRTAAPSPFSALLSDWHSGRMREQLSQLGLTRPEFHIDWLDDYKCIGIQGRWGRRYVDIQIEPGSFLIAADAVEPDEPEVFLLGSADGFYRTLHAILES